MQTVGLNFEKNKLVTLIVVMWQRVNCVAIFHYFNGKCVSCFLTSLSFMSNHCITNAGQRHCDN